jgi:pyruvate kinase
MKANPEMVKKAEYMIEGVINAGINTIRLNFSHGTHEEQQIRVELTRGVSRRLNKPISVLYDTKGPEIRCHDFGGEGKDTVNKGATVTIECLKKVEGNAKKFSVTDSSGKYNMAKDCKIGNLVCIDDGKLRLKITDVKVAAGQVICEALNTHVIGTKKRINLPGAEYSMPFLSEKDINDTKFACENNYDYLAASFTNSASDINAIKTICRKSGGSGKTIKIIAKIETMAGCRNLESIINACDGIMVARGDLGIEIPYFEVPY